MSLIPEFNFDDIIIEKYNVLMNSIDKSLSVFDIFSDFSDEDWIWFIAGKTYEYGRSAKDSYNNAIIHLKMSSKKQLIEIWSKYKKSGYPIQ